MINRQIFIPIYISIENLHQKRISHLNINSLRYHHQNQIYHLSNYQQNLSNKFENKTKEHLYIKQSYFPSISKPLKSTKSKLEQKESINRLDYLISQTNSQQQYQQIQKDLLVPNSTPSHRSFSNPKYYITYLLEAFKQPLSQDTISKLYREQILQTYTSLQFCATLKQVSFQELEQKMIHFPRKSNFKFEKTIVFDLDETLIHCNQNSTQQSNVKVNVTLPSGQIVQAGINVRPFAKQILSELSKLCEVFIFTASHQSYASRVIQIIDPDNCLSGYFYRDRCIVTEGGVHIKDLRVFQRDLKEIVLIDNAAYSFGYQISNGIPIIPFEDNSLDQELLMLEDFLKTEILPAKDVREVLKDYFKLHRYLSSSSIHSLYK